MEENMSKRVRLTRFQFGSESDAATLAARNLERQGWQRIVVERVDAAEPPTMDNDTYRWKVTLSAYVPRKRSKDGE